MTSIELIDAIVEKYDATPVDTDVKRVVQVIAAHLSKSTVNDLEPALQTLMADFSQRHTPDTCNDLRNFALAILKAIVEDSADER